jgi:hypothetical protein
VVNDATGAVTPDQIVKGQIVDWTTFWSLFAATFGIPLQRVWS